MVEDIKQAAINEILAPTFGTTEQFLQVMKVKTEHSVPMVSRVKIYDNGKSAAVYFPVEDEYFFITVYFDLGDNTIKVRSVETEVGSAVYLSVKNSSGTEFPITPESVRDDFNIYGVEINQPDDVQDKLDNLLNYLEPHAELIRKIAAEITVTIHIQYFGYRDQMWGLHFDSAFMKRIANLNVELDFDIYADGESLY